MRDAVLIVADCARGPRTTDWNFGNSWNNQRCPRRCTDGLKQSVCLIVQSSPARARYRYYKSNLRVQVVVLHAEAMVSEGGQTKPSL